jgi:phage FluMu protein Com
MNKPPTALHEAPMEQKTISCPACGVQLAGVSGMADCVIKCGRCHARFRLGKKPATTDDTVASWLQEGKHSRDADNLDDMATPGKGHQLDPPHSGGTHILAALTEPLRVVKTDRQGVLLEFPSSRMTEIPFRCSMPHKCLQCGSRTHLKAHVVIFSTGMKDSISLEAEHSAGDMIISEETFRGATGLDMLRMLPHVPNVPHPANLPIPYWLCDMCSGAGMISGQVQINSATGNGWCRLLFRSTRRAMEFMGAAGAAATEDYQKLAAQVTSTRENPWDSISEAVQHRLQQWFRLSVGESFVAYTPDRDRARTEDGMAGLVVTNIRLIYHTQMRHRESSVKDPVEIQYAMAGVRGVVEIKTPHWEIKHMTVDRDGADRLRRGLSSAKFNATWK